MITLVYILVSWYIGTLVYWYIGIKLLGIFCIVSLPRLIDFDWKVNIKSSSDSASRMAAPTCLVQMNVRLHPLIKPSHAHKNKYDVGGFIPRVNQRNVKCMYN